MSIYDIKTVKELTENNSYVGRGIVIGKSANGKNAVSAYFIMGRSENSRNLERACQLQVITSET